MLSAWVQAASAASRLAAPCLNHLPALQTLSSLCSSREFGGLSVLLPDFGKLVEVHIDPAYNLRPISTTFQEEQAGASTTVQCLLFSQHNQARNAAGPFSSQVLSRYSTTSAPQDAITDENPFKVLWQLSQQIRNKNIPSDQLLPYHNTLRALEPKLLEEFERASDTSLLDALQNALTLRYPFSLKTMAAVYRHRLIRQPPPPYPIPPRTAFLLLRALSFQPGRKTLPYHLFQAVQADIHNMSPSDLPSLLRIMACFHHRTNSFLGPIINSLKRNIPHFTVVDLYYTITALATLKIKNDPLVTAITQQALPSLTHHNNPLHVATFLSHATQAQAVRDDPRMMGGITSVISTKAHSFTPIALVPLIHLLHHTSLPPSSIWHTRLENIILPIISSLLPHTNREQLASIVNALANSSVSHPVVIATALNTTTEQLAHFRTSQFVHAVYAASTIHSSEAVTLLATAATIVESGQRQFTGNQLAKLLVAFSALPQHTQLMQSILSQLSSQLHTVTESNLELCVRALVQMKGRDAWPGEGVAEQVMAEVMMRLESPVLTRAAADVDSLAVAVLKELAGTELLDQRLQSAVVMRLTQADCSSLGLSKLSTVLLTLDSAKLAWQPLQREVLKRLPNLAASLTPQHLAELLHICRQQLTHPDVPPLNDALSVAILLRLNDHNVYTLSRALLAMTRQAPSDSTYRMLDAVGHHVVANLLPKLPMRHSSAAQLSRLLLAYKEFHSHHEPLFDASAAAVVGKLLPVMALGHIAFTVQAFAQLRDRREAMFLALADRVVDLSLQEQSLESQFLSIGSICRAYARVGVLHTGMMDRLTMVACKLAGPTKTRSVVDLVVACGQLQYCNEQWLTVAANVMRDGVMYLRPKELTDVVVVYKQFEHPLTQMLEEIAALMPERKEDVGGDAGVGWDADVVEKDVDVAGRAGKDTAGRTLFSSMA